MKGKTKMGKSLVEVVSLHTHPFLFSHYINLTQHITVKIYKYLFLKECIDPVMEHIFETRSQKQFSYAAVQALDRKVRAFDFGTLASEVQSDVGVNNTNIANGSAGGGGGEAEQPSLAGMMQRQLVLCVKESGELFFFSFRSPSCLVSFSPRFPHPTPARRSS
jgi:hypothetical protein